MLETQPLFKLAASWSACPPAILFFLMIIIKGDMKNSRVHWQLGMIGSSIMNYHEIGMPFAKPTGFWFFSGKHPLPLPGKFNAGYTTVGSFL